MKQFLAYFYPVIYNWTSTSTGKRKWWKRRLGSENGPLTRNPAGGSQKRHDGISGMNLRFGYLVGEADLDRDGIAIGPDKPILNERTIKPGEAWL